MLINSCIPTYLAERSIPPPPASTNTSSKYQAPPSCRGRGAEVFNASQLGSLQNMKMPLFFHLSIQKDHLIASVIA